MKTSNFQFTDPKIKNIELNIYDNADFEGELPVSINIEKDINEELKKAVARLTIIIGTQDKTEDNTPLPLYFKGTITANFRWEEEIENPDKMIEINGGAVLLSYIRPVISTLTMQAGIKPVVIPFVNFID